MKEDRFPSLPQAFFVLLALFLLEYVIGLALYDARGLLNLSRSANDVFVVLLANGVVFTVLMQAKGMTFRELFHSSRASVRATALLLLPPVAMLVPVLLLVGGELSNLLVKLFPLSRWEEQSFARMGEGSLGAIVAVCLLAPVVEEMLFRGIILRAFLHQYQRGMAIFSSALVFGVAHMNIYQFAVAFLIGVLCGWLYERARSLIPCIGLHAFYNSAVTVLGLDSERPEVQQASSSAAATWVLALVAAGLGAWILWRVLGQKAPGGPAAAGRD